MQLKDRDPLIEQSGVLSKGTYQFLPVDRVRLDYSKVDQPPP